MGCVSARDDVPESSMNSLHENNNGAGSNGQKRGVLLGLIENHTDPVIYHWFNVLVGGATAAASVIWAQAVAVPSTWWEAGPYVLFCGSLMYAVIHLWRAVQACHKESHERAAQQEERARKTIENQSATMDRLAKSIDRLSGKGGEDGRD